VNACAVPWKVALSVGGTCSSSVALFTSAIASESATPGRRSNDRVTEGSWPRWLTEKRAYTVGQLGHGRSAHQRPGRGAHVEQGQHRRVGLVARFEFQNHPVLVGRGIDGRNLVRTVGIVQCHLDLLRADAER